MYLSRKARDRESLSFDRQHPCQNESFFPTHQKNSARVILLSMNWVVINLKVSSSQRCPKCNSLGQSTDVGCGWYQSERWGIPVSHPHRDGHVDHGYDVDRVKGVISWSLDLTRSYSKETSMADVLLSACQVGSHLFYASNLTVQEIDAVARNIIE